MLIQSSSATSQTKEEQFADEEGGVSRKERATGSTHFGDVDFAEEHTEEIGDATWSEVCRTCCVHSPQEWGLIALGLFMVMFFLYFFLVGLSLLGTAAKVLGGCTAGSLFGDDTNPVAGVMVGILATVLIQSSSSTTSIIVSLVGAGSITVKSGIFMVMGANIGTSVTNTIVAMGHLGDGDELERAFAGATVHDMFNFLAVAVLFPIELITGYLFYLSRALVPNEVASGDKWVGPIGVLVDPLAGIILKANKSVTTTLAKDKEANCDSGGVFYPVFCLEGEVSYKTCVPPKGGCADGVECPKVGLITCDKDAGCPAFFQDGATRRDDEISGAVVFFLALVILIGCLIGLVTILQKMLMGMSTRIIYKATNINGYLAMLIGAGITILVQSSSITTSALTPFVGMGALRLEQMFPLTLGANIGTTFTGLLASLVSSSVDSLQVALCHLFFNITGILIWYPIPFMRRVPLAMARALGKGTRIWRGFPILYIFICFVFIPIILFGLSSLFTQDSKGYTVLGSFLVIALILMILLFTYKWIKGGLKESVVQTFEKRQRRKTYEQALPDDIDAIKSELARLREHTGLAEDEEEIVEAEVAEAEAEVDLEK
jgi:sodium-dependent phosphate cotransporter